MPLTMALMRMVVDTLQYVDTPKRWRAFNALRTVLDLTDDEMKCEMLKRKQAKGEKRKLNQENAEILKFWQT